MVRSGTFRLKGPYPDETLKYCDREENDIFFPVFFILYLFSDDNQCLIHVKGGIDF
jgi:hypothetical protein